MDEQLKQPQRPRDQPPYGPLAMVREQSDSPVGSYATVGPCQLYPFGYTSSGLFPQPGSPAGRKPSVPAEGQQRSQGPCRVQQDIMDNRRGGKILAPLSTRPSASFYTLSSLLQKSCSLWYWDRYNFCNSCQVELCTVPGQLPNGCLPSLAPSGTTPAMSTIPGVDSAVNCYWIRASLFCVSINVTKASFLSFLFLSLFLSSLSPLSLFLSLSLSFLKGFIYLFLERGKGREKKRERNIDMQEKPRLVASRMPPTGDLPRPVSKQM